MLGECDHGLSDEGREQAQQLGKNLATAKKDLQYGTLPAARMHERPWIERALAPDSIICSPFTRALQTAVIALEDILKENNKTLKVVPDAREIKTSVCSMDSTGELKGQDLRDHLRKELELFYKKDA